MLARFRDDRTKSTMTVAFLVNAPDGLPKIVINTDRTHVVEARSVAAEKPSPLDEEAGSGGGRIGRFRDALDRGEILDDEYVHCPTDCR